MEIFAITSGNGDTQPYANARGRKISSNAYFQGVYKSRANTKGKLCNDPVAQSFFYSFSEIRV